MQSAALVAAPENHTAVNSCQTQPLEGGSKGWPTGVLFTANWRVGGEMGDTITQALR